MSTNKIHIDKSELLALVKDGLTDREIAEKLFIGESTVQARRKEYGIARYTKIYDKHMFDRMKQVGLTDDEVCFIWSCSRTDLTKWKHRVGLARKYKQSRKKEGERQIIMENKKEEH